MCGVLGFATVAGGNLAVGREATEAMRDLLAHRGPDAAGLVHERHVALAHRRLALLDPTGGVQPFLLAEPGLARVVLAWNGEIYDHESLRAEFERDGRRFRTRSDTETLAYVLAAHGVDGLRRLRGMFALAAWFPDDHRLVIARDPFGIVPLFHARAGREVVFASEPAPILAHPHFSVEPDWATVASYLEIPRRSYGSATLFRGISMVEPGEAIEFDLSDPRLPATHHSFAAPPEHASLGDDEAALEVRAAVENSVAAHLVADAPLATLLSGGIDSTIDDAARPGSDLFMARHVAKLLGSRHHEVVISAERFVIEWERMIGEGAHPLATPNEVAIALLGRAISPHAKAALTGEGADEVFGGYGAPIEATLAWIDAETAHTAEGAADFYRSAFGWAPRALLGELFREETVRKFGDDGDDPLGDLLGRAFADAGDLSSIEAHLSVQRRVNLVNLLERLNLSLMRGSVEGRVPFADIRVLEAAMRAGGAHLLDHEPSGGGTATTTLQTKRVLRRAFADVLPAEIAGRPKASFPLPFESWIEAQSHWIDGPIAREVFSPAARELVRTQAMQHWRLAWPMLNVARWLDAAFGG